MVPFVVLPVLARWLGPQAFGVVGNYLAMVNIAAVVAGLSVHGIVSVVHFRDGAASVPPHYRAALRLLLFTSLPLAAVLFAFGSPLEQATSVPRHWIWTIAVAAAGQFVISLSLAVFQAREQAIHYAAIQISLALCWGALSLFFAGVLGWGWTSRAVAQLIALSVACGFVGALLRREHVLDTRDKTLANMGVLLRFGVPLVPHSLAAALMSSADRLVLSGYVGAEAAGLYFAAFQWAAVLSVGALAANQAWVPWLYRRLAANSETSRREVVRATYGINAILMLCAAMVAVSGQWLLPWVAGPAYLPSVQLLYLLAPAAAFSGMYYFATNHLFYKGRTGLLSAVTVSCSAVLVLLMLWWVPQHGATGAAAAVLVGNALYWASTWLASQWVSPMPWLMRNRTPINAEGAQQAGSRQI